ncbi:amidase family protein [Paraburkholderia fungorum]|uniref:amidase family protein n=1 Tax=Paraburkholderia fungorum TaxID=134537 RepID=UPI0038BAD68F
MSMIDLGAAEAIAAMRTGDIKAEDYAGALLTQAAKCERLNAFLTLEPQTVMSAAHEADKARLAGRRLGILHGLPVPMKDSVATRALPTSGGTRTLRGFVPTADAEIVTRLQDEGAILMGKTNLSELSFGWTNNNAVFGPVRNPYDTDCIPGGSSGGSGAAVAARIAPLALAEDTLGSIRVPASCGGIAGFRPTYGRYPNRGAMPLSMTNFDQVGPLARSVTDLALFDSAVTGAPQNIDGTPLDGVRIGVAAHFWSNLDPEVERLGQEVLRKLRASGAVIVEADIPDTVKAAEEIAFAIIGHEIMPGITAYLAIHGSSMEFEQIFAGASEGVQSMLAAMAMPPNRPDRSAYEAALARREELVVETRRHFRAQGITALVFPTIMTPPPRIGEDTEVEINGRKVPISVAMARNASLGSCASMASLVLPAGLSSRGLPVGVEFTSLAHTDRALLSLGLSLEDALGVRPTPQL